MTPGVVPSSLAFIFPDTLLIKYELLQKRHGSHGMNGRSAMFLKIDLLRNLIEISVLSLSAHTFYFSPLVFSLFTIFISIMHLSSSLERNSTEPSFWMNSSEANFSHGGNDSSEREQRQRWEVAEEEDGDQHPFLTDAWLVPLFFSLIMLVGLVGNSLVIYVISKHRQMRTATNFYIANLAATDIIFLVCCVPFTATLYPLPGWIFGNFLCKFVAFMQQVTVQATCITLTAMSGDRCYITIYPLKSLRHRTPRVAMIVSVCIWIGSLILSTPILMYQRIEEGYWYGPRQYCMERFPSKIHERAFILYQFIAAYLLPVFTISFCYGLMVKRVGQPTVEPGDNNYQVNLLSERTISIRSKVSKMVVVIVLLFALCWGPIQIFVLFQSFSPDFRATYTTYKIKTWANCMSYANSSVNPIVYGFMGASFQKSFRKTFPFLYRHKVRDSSMASRTANAEIKFVAAEEGNNNNDAN
ncbi:KISS1 receptor a isoform X2 [Corythoichthys intestinalis]|uniref:KISS1 receptor a isoform X2 n=1 Tax=Corythoichthys intestinalis TaxID=161448 RepID=UPI0025A5D410|nr:KISS1 receptor a isoform X2 [Corythoichthys intestinalis]